MLQHLYWMHPFVLFPDLVTSFELTISNFLQTICYMKWTWIGVEIWYGHTLFTLNINRIYTYMNSMFLLSLSLSSFDLSLSSARGDVGLLLFAAAAAGFCPGTLSRFANWDRFVLNASFMSFFSFGASLVGDALLFCWVLSSPFLMSPFAWVSLLSAIDKYNIRNNW